MKVRVDNQDLFELSETHKKVIKNDILDEVFENDMKRRLQYIIMHKYEKCFERLKKEWVDDVDGNGQNKLKRNNIESIPIDRDQLAELIFSQPNYKNRSQRESEEK